MKKLTIPRPYACLKKGCSEYVCIKAQKFKKKLCKEHLKEWLLKKKKCPICKNEITNRRNKKYCSAICWRTAMRYIDNNDVVKVTKTAVWQRVERQLRDSTLGLASLYDYEDIFQLYALQSAKKIYEQYFKPHYVSLNVTLVHLHPLEYGGMNVVDNILVAPKVLVTKYRNYNRGHCESNYKGEFAKHDPQNIPIEISLFRTLAKSKTVAKAKQERDELLVKLCGCIKIELIEKTIHKNPIDLFNYPTTLPYLNLFVSPLFVDTTNINRQRIIFKHLKEQTKRFDSWKELSSFLNFIDKEVDLNNEYLTGLFFELLAISIYHSLINGNTDNFIEKIINKKADIEYSFGRKNRQEMNLIFETVIEYVNQNFNQTISTEVKDFLKFISFYEQFFIIRTNRE